MAGCIFIREKGAKPAGTAAGECIMDVVGIRDCTGVASCIGATSPWGIGSPCAEQMRAW